MVLINLKISEKNQFLHECKTTDDINKILKDLVTSKFIIYNIF